MPPTEQSGAQHAQGRRREWPREQVAGPRHRETDAGRQEQPPAERGGGKLVGLQPAQAHHVGADHRRDREQHQPHPVEVADDHADVAPCALRIRRPIHAPRERHDQQRPAEHPRHGEQRQAEPPHAQQPATGGDDHRRRHKEPGDDHEGHHHLVAVDDHLAGERRRTRRLGEGAREGPEPRSDAPAQARSHPGTAGSPVGSAQCRRSPCGSRPDHRVRRDSCRGHRLRRARGSPSPRGTDPTPRSAEKTCEGAAVRGPTPSPARRFRDSFRT